MAAGILLAGGQLGEGASELQVKEERIVPEPPTPPPPLQDPPRRLAPKALRPVVPFGPGIQAAASPRPRGLRLHKGGHAHIAGPPFRLRNPAQRFEQPRIVGLVARESGKSSRRRKAFRPHPGASVQRIHLEAGVVGDGRQAGRAGKVTSLRRGVLLEGLPRFERVLGTRPGKAGIVQRQDPRSPALLQDARHLARLVHAARRQKNLHRRTDG